MTLLIFLIAQTAPLDITDGFVLKVMAAHVDALSPRNVLTIGGDSKLRHWDGRKLREIPSSSAPRELAFVNESVAAIETRTDVRFIDCRSGKVLRAFRSAKLIRSKRVPRCFVMSKTAISRVEMRAGRLSLQRAFPGLNANDDVLDLDVSPHRLLVQDFASGHVMLKSRSGRAVDLGEGRDAAFDGPRHVLLVGEDGEVRKVDSFQRQKALPVRVPFKFLDAIAPFPQGGFFLTGQDYACLVTPQGVSYGAQDFGTDILDTAITAKGEMVIATRGGWVAWMKVPSHRFPKLRF